MLDLAGSRDFLDAETARHVLGPLLLAGAAHKHVSHQRTTAAHVCQLLVNMNESLPHVTHVSHV